MKKIVALVALIWLYGLGVNAQMRRNQAYQLYIEQYKDVAVEQMLRYNIPASITLAQGLLESGAGRSTLATKGNNHFGIKCHDWTGPSMQKDDDERNECFRVYNSARESYEDHSKFLCKGQRYRSLFSLSRTDYKGWARGLKAAGYATNPAYASKLIGIIELYGLDQYDRQTRYDKFLVQRSNDKPAVTGGSLHRIYRCNKNYYIIAREGDTFKSIGKEVGISWRKLARYNERDKHHVLHNGDIVYLKKKRTKADKSFKHVPHVVKPGESMYSIAQMYGIRLKSLYEKNDLPTFYDISVGDRLRVY